MKAIKTFALSSISLVLLSGCFFDESYDPTAGPSHCDPSEGNPTANPFRLYDHTRCSDTRFNLVIEDEAGKLTVPSNGRQELANIKTEPAGSWSREAPVKVSVYNEQPAAILMESSTPIDITIPATGQQEGQKGIVKFFIKPLTTPVEGERVLLTLPTSEISHTQPIDETPSFDGSAYAYFDLTSAMHAYRGIGITQEVKVAASCFIDKGVDFSNMNQPFRLVSESDFEFELSMIMLQGNAAGQAHVLHHCETDSEVLTDDVSLVMARRRDESGSVSRKGWSNRRGSHINVKAGNPNTTAGDPNDGDRITFENDSGERIESGSFQLRLSNGEAHKDISRFVENGFLQFEIHVENYGLKPSRDILVYFESDKYSERRNNFRTYPVSDIQEGKDVVVDIPVSELLITENAGQGDRIDVGLIQHISGLRVEVNADEDDPEDDLTGLQFIINEIHLTQPVLANPK